MSATKPGVQPWQVQRLVAGCDLDAGRHLVLEVLDAGAARQFLAAQLRDGRITFADADGRRTGKFGAVNVGFTYKGLEEIGAAADVLQALAERAPEYAEGAAARAERRLGDTGASAPARWDAAFADHRAHVVLVIRADSTASVRAIAAALEAAPSANRAFAGWDRFIDTGHLTNGPDPSMGRKVRTVHFGFRDDIARPRVVGLGTRRGSRLHAAGELLLGFDNEAGFDRWSAPPALADFFRHGSFVVLRRIEQDEQAFRGYLDAQVQRLSPMHWQVDAEYLKAKMCGRWANGARVEPGHTREQQAGAVDDGFDFGDDREGHGCPFGAHIRRTNPRADAVVPQRPRVLFRRGMPYGPAYAKDEPPGVERGLLGVFCCASIEDQFEFVIGQWVEANPIGTAIRGDAKDPLIGHHDDPGARFHVPLPGSQGLWLDGFAPFVRTRGTLYTLFPSRAALEAIAGVGAPRGRAAARTAAPAPPAAAGAGSASVTAPASTPSRYCDIVMEGGVTSGIVYAGAVHELSKAYRFHAIGGTSVGAFAAALTAAAEYRRRAAIGGGGHDDTGFELLGELPTKLGERAGGGATLLDRLFKPQPETRRPFAVVHAALGHASKAAAALAATRQAVVTYRWHAALWFVGFLLLAAAGPLSLACWGDCAAAWTRWVAPETWLPAMLLTIVLAAVVATLFGVLGGLVTDLLRGLVGNGFGLCRGWSTDATSLDADLTGFMHTTIQRLAGRSESDAPLTFADLWRAPGGPPGAAADDGRGARSIRLELYSTNLSHGRPYRFPRDERDDDMQRLFFRPEELEPYFPAAVLNHLKAHAVRYAPRARHDPDPGAAWQGCWELPAEHLPLVVAARISMSFPLLLSAVPLYAIDYEAQQRERRGPRRCWMSDGGLCTNFPIHLFDALVPRWPTFGISLQRRPPGDGRRVWLPDKHYEGRGDSWLDDIDAHSRSARVFAFVFGLWRAGSTWNDMALLRMPAVRDRVVRVLLDEGEGGVNIRMSPTEIDRLASYGAEAACALVAKFVDPGLGWAEHRWVRFNRLVTALRAEIDGFAATVQAHGGAPALADQIAQALAGPALRGPHDPSIVRDPSEARLNAAQAKELRRALKVLRWLEQAMARPSQPPPYRAMPRAELRVRPPA